MNTQAQLLTVVYRPLREMIADGNYNSHNWREDLHMEMRFPVEETGVAEFEFCLTYFGRNISTVDAVLLMKDNYEENPWQQAGIEHLLAYGATFPEKQRECPIVALGAVDEDGNNWYAPFLNGDASGRSLCYTHWDTTWHESCYFLMVRRLGADQRPVVVDDGICA